MNAQNRKERNIQDTPIDLLADDTERHNLIKEEAYFIAERRGFEPGHSIEDWLLAEQIISERIQNEMNEPTSIYRSLMSKFYKSACEEINDSKHLAIKYLDYIYDNIEVFRGLKRKINYCNKFDFRNISILSRNTELSFLTKRSLLMADSTLLSHESNCVTKYKSKLSFCDPSYDIYEDDYYVTNCANLNELGTWLNDCKELLMMGDVFYYPKIIIARDRQDWHDADGGWEGLLISDDYVFDAIVSSRKIVEPINNNFAKSKLVKFITSVDIPFIDTINLSDFSKITCDEHQKLGILRDYLREQFIEIMSKEGSMAYEKEIKKIGIHIKRDMKLLTSDIKRLSRKYSIQSAGAIIGTVVATLVAINSSMFREISTIVGTGGGLAIWSHLLSEYIENKSKLEDSPYYYLWLLGNNP